MRSDTQFKRASCNDVIHVDTVACTFYEQILLFVNKYNHKEFRRLSCSNVIYVDAVACRVPR